MRIEQGEPRERRRDGVRSGARIEEDPCLHVEVIAPARLDKRRSTAIRPARGAFAQLGSCLVLVEEAVAGIGRDDVGEGRGAEAVRDAEERTEVPGRALHRLGDDAQRERRTTRDLRQPGGVEGVIRVRAAPLPPTSPSLDCPRGADGGRDVTSWRGYHRDPSSSGCLPCGETYAHDRWAVSPGPPLKRFMAETSHCGAHLEAVESATPGRVAQWESARFTRERSLVQAQPCPSRTCKMRQLDSRARSGAWAWRAETL